MAAPILTTYLGAGPIGSRPATPALVAGTVGLWWDTGGKVMTAYDLVNNAWNSLGVSPPTIVQQKSVVSTNSVVLGAAPTQNNLLIALTSDLGASETTGAGWTKISFTAGSQDGAGFYWKIAGASESTTQSPITSLSTGSVTIFEINNATPAALFVNNIDLSGSAINITYNCAKNSAKLIIGVACNRTTTGPTSITGATMLSGSASGGSRFAQPFSVNSPTQGSGQTVTANYATSQGACCPTIEVG